MILLGLININMSENKLVKNEENIDFLQSEEWRKFQENSGKRTFHLPQRQTDMKQNSLWVNVIEHKLPLVGRYFYVPRWPLARIFNFQSLIFNQLLELAKKEKAGWIRFEPENEEILNLIRKNINHKIEKAPHDMQPKEVFTIDIRKSEEEILAKMKPKTRYNINLAQKRGVSVQVISNETLGLNDRIIDRFIEMVNSTAKRKGITFHPGDYYRTMIKTIPGEILKIYVAKFNDKIIAANLVVFYGKTAIYLHGATDDEYRNVMASYLLQWQAILDAKRKGCEKYDFGGVRLQKNDNPWSGITKFKIGFSPNVGIKKFPGSYDVVINRAKYEFYVIISKLRRQKNGGG